MKDYYDNISTINLYSLSSTHDIMTLNYSNFFLKKEENQSRSCNISISQKKKKIATYQYQYHFLSFLKENINFPLKKINITFHFIVFYNQISTLQTYYFLTKRTLIMLPDTFLYILFQGNKQILVNPSIKLSRLVY